MQPRPRAWDRSAQPDKSLVPGSTPDTHRRHRIGPDGTGRRQSTCSQRRHRGSSSGLPHQVSARRQPGPVCGRWSGTRRCDDGRLTTRIPGQTAQRRPRRWCAESAGAASIAGIQAEFRSTSRPTAAPSARSRTRCAGAKAVRFDAHGGVIVSVLRPGVCFAGAAKDVLAKPPRRSGSHDIRNRRAPSRLHCRPADTAPYFPYLQGKYGELIMNQQRGGGGS